MVHKYKKYKLDIPHFYFNEKILSKKYKNINIHYELVKIKLIEKMNLLMKMLYLEPNVTFYKNEIFFLKKSPLSEIVYDLEFFLEPIKYSLNIKDFTIQMLQKYWIEIFKFEKNNIINHKSKINLNNYITIENDDINYHFIFKILKYYKKYGSNYIPAIIFLLKDIKYDIEYVLNPLNKISLPSLCL